MIGDMKHNYISLIAFSFIFIHINPLVMIDELSIPSSISVVVFHFFKVGKIRPGKPVGNRPNLLKAAIIFCIYLGITR